MQEITWVHLSFFFLLQNSQAFAFGRLPESLFDFPIEIEEPSFDIIPLSEHAQLERRSLHSEIFNPGDLNRESKFPDFLEPNERGVINISKHLNQASMGILVSTGTERSFFDLILCKKCTGLVVRDINPHVKAYVDFNVLLLKLAIDLNDYNFLSLCRLFPLESYQEEIRSRIESSKHIKGKAKNYYLEHLKSLIENYWKASGK